ncbi:DUF1772 domain-containing protein [Amaricoccus macauensis]|uniref:anthrone oxygenase family protein n=1 Tax=Amaricoccus macauensis TaxID=57001 RepID=UPI003C7B1DB6
MARHLPSPLAATALTALILHGAIFGFFYAWVCSTMWGLDTLPPLTAIEAMRAMNGSVRNAVFAPAFFATPFVSLAVAAWAWRSGRANAARRFAAAGIVYLLGGLVLTMAVNVPMNEALALVALPENTEALRQIWEAYSGPWQVWNQIRTIFSGIALLLAGMGLLKLA